MRSPQRAAGPRYIETRIGSRFTPGVIALLVVYATTYLLGLIPPVERFIVQYLVLRPEDALGPRPYQLLTAPALMTSLLSLAFVALLLWSIGSAVESRAGTRRFLVWVAGSSVVAAVGAALVGRIIPSLAVRPVILDAQPLFMVVLIAFAEFYGDLPVRMWGIGEPVSGRGLSYFFIGIGLLAELLRGDWPGLAAQLFALGTMLLILRRPWTRLRTRPRKVRRGGLEVLNGGRGAAGWGPKKDEPRWLN